MKIEPRKIKKTLKYAAVGTCVAASLISTGCDKPEVVGAVPAVDINPTRNVEFAGFIPVKPKQTIPPYSKYDQGIKKLPTPNFDELILDGDIAYPETTPEIVGDIPAPDIDDEADDDIEFAGESAFYFEEE